MSGVKRWRDTNHLDRAIETAGGVEVFERTSPRCSTRLAAGVWRSCAGGET